MKIELGGGATPRGEGFINYDQCDSADVVCDLRNGIPLPDDSVSEVYSSHFLEHIPAPFSLLNDVARVCKTGSPVEIRVPHPLGDMAMVDGHVHVFSEQAVVNADSAYPELCWHGPKRLKLIECRYQPSQPYFDEAVEWVYAAMPGVIEWINAKGWELAYWIQRFIPRTCHECCFFFECQLWDGTNADALDR